MERDIQIQWNGYKPAQDRQLELCQKALLVLVLKVVVVVLCVSTGLIGVYAQRQRQWAIKLSDQLTVTNQDDVKMMNILTKSEKQDISHRFRRQGETRIADWISNQ